MYENNIFIYKMISKARDHENVFISSSMHEQYIHFIEADFKV